MNEREQTVYKARLAEQSERYDGKDTHFSALLYVVLSSVCGMCADRFFLRYAFLRKHCQSGTLYGSRTNCFVTTINFSPLAITNYIELVNRVFRVEQSYSVGNQI